VTSVASGAGLAGGPITTSGTLGIATGGVTNAMLAHPSLTIMPGTDLMGGGVVPLGGATTLSVDTSKVPQLGTPNTFTGTQTISNGDLNLPATALGSTAGVINLGGSPFIHECCFNGVNGYTNTFVGLSAGNLEAAGMFSTAIGHGALQSNVSIESTASGFNALFHNTKGSWNTASGSRALFANTTGMENTASGAYTLFANTTGTGNTANGLQALFYNTTGNDNTASGADALYCNTTGSDNTAVGEAAGFHSGEPCGLGTGSNGTFVGAYAQPTVDGLTNATAIGVCASVSTSDALVLGAAAGDCDGISNAETKVGIDVPNPSNVFTVLKGGGHAISDGWDTYSSRRWKSDIEPLQGALGKVELLRGVSYTYTASGKHDIGMIAEEVGQVVPEVVSYEENGKDARGIDYARLTALLVEAVKEQQKEVQQQQSQVRQQQRQIRQQKAEIRTLQARLQRLEATNSGAVQTAAKPAKTSGKAVN